MNILQVNQRQAIIDEIQVYIKKNLPNKQIPMLQAFAQRFFSACSYEDLQEHSLAYLVGALLSSWNFIYQREPGETKIRICEPNLEEDGWSSTHTIIEISHDDIPFLVDSTRMEISRQGYQIHFIIHIGGLKVRRDDQFRITEILPIDAKENHVFGEAPIYIEIDRLPDEAAKQALHAGIQRVLHDVSVCVADWRKMIARVKECLSQLEDNPPPLDSGDIAESRDFLEWLINNNFTFLGSRDYKLIGDGTNRALQVVPGSGLGVLREDSVHVATKTYAELPPQARKMALSKQILIIAKTNTKSTVHRSAYTDYIGVKLFDQKGMLIGERRFIGLYTSSAYHSSPRLIPFLRHKVDNVTRELHFPPDSHDGKEVVHILETLPRDDLFQGTTEELFQLTIGILRLEERKRVRLFVRRDAYYRYFSCLVYVPREIFTTDLAVTMQDVLMQNFRGIESSFTTYFSDSVLARIHYEIRVNPKAPIEFNVAQIEKELVSVARSWTDELKDQLLAHFGEAAGLKIYLKYRKAFPASYTEYYNPSEAIQDIQTIESLSAENPLGMIFYQSDELDNATLRLKLFHAEQTIVLSDVLPALENMGLRIIGERPHELRFIKEGIRVWINAFDMTYVSNKKIDVESIRDIFQEAFAKIWFQHAENDGLNRLTLEGRLNWREIAMLRAYTKYLRQIGFAFSQSYIEQAFIKNVHIARDLAELFKLRFSPALTAEQRALAPELVKNILHSLEAVTSLDEDRILNRVLEVMQATIRTNYFQKAADGSDKAYISYKLSPELISELPLPKPKYEIFIYAPRVEGIHLRGGKVARGGIRWSDRREDFRTEVLGLMKAQQVKNALIVPVGAKGGFVVKRMPNSGNRDEIMKEVIDCYSTFIRGLLDITDNLKDNKVIFPKEVVRYDEDDPYLVVAADKGTATFSDIANSIANEYGFWLGDAFASGGSSGYDHKKMGITSRGVWESVKRHFRYVGLDPERDDFTVVGIGDMSGDVFGNGMLLSKHIKLVGAFNHDHIFLDPDPNPEASYEERKRLFHLPRSTWMDYDQKLISPGGGVFERSAKSIKLTPEIKTILALDTDKEFMVPNEVIRAMLKSPVDLLWNGGIGTFVKSVQESQADAGDRTNDNIRIDGHEVNVKVVAEGGNLGFTQLARVEYSLKGGIMYTDFIDNSGGVNCSDHEVNIKILLNKLLMNGKMTLEARDKLLEQMTEEVASLVLYDNYEQTQMLSLEASVSGQTMDLFRRYMNDLEKSGKLNRKLESLPSDKTLLERKANNQPLTRPEIAMLLAYCKMFLKQEILETDVPEDPYFIKYLLTAFPKPLREKYLSELKEHSLRREIITTQLSKSITDRMGINFVERIQRETGATIAFIIRCNVIAESIYGTEVLWKEIESLDSHTVPSEQDRYILQTRYQSEEPITPITPFVQNQMMLQIYYLIRRATRWFLRNRKANINIQQTIDDFGPAIMDLIQHLPELLSEPDKEKLHAEIKYLLSNGVPFELARKVASCEVMFTSLDIIEAAQKYQLDLYEVARVYYSLGDTLGLDWLRELMYSYVVENQWDELARSGFRDDLDRVQRKLAVSVLTLKNKEAKGKNIDERIEIWMHQHKFLMERWQTLLADIKASDNVGFVTYSLVLRELFDFAQVA